MIELARAELKGVKLVYTCDMSDDGSVCCYQYSVEQGGDIFKHRSLEEAVEEFVLFTDSMHPHDYRYQEILADFHNEALDKLYP